MHLKSLEKVQIVCVTEYYSTSEDNEPQCVIGDHILIQLFAYQLSILKLIIQTLKIYKGPFPYYQRPFQDFDPFLYETLILFFILQSQTHMQLPQQENMNENPQEEGQSQGRKRPKLDNKKEKVDQLDFRQIIHEKFDPQQVKRLVDHLKDLQNYYKFVSLQIQHQERSISTLPSHLHSSFPQLKNRVATMIQKAKYNVQFLDLILFPYKTLVLQAILAQKRKGDSDESQEIGHDHSCGNHNAIANMFYHMVREWGEGSELQYCNQILEYLDRYLSANQGQKLKILVVGSGMGRILHQIRKKYRVQHIQVQGHESDTQLYLCGEYFLNRCVQAHIVYPYLHNFCNFRTNNDPYRCINIPTVIDNHSFYYPLTLGSFPSLYKTHEGNWDVVITIFNNYHIDNILTNLRLVYKMLKPDGLWIDLSTSNFDRNIIPFSYREFQNVLDRSQFKLLEKHKECSHWYGDKECLMNEMRVNYYRAMRKQ